MNSDIYAAVVEAIGPALRRAAHANIEPMRTSYYRSGVKRSALPEYDFVLNLRPFARLQHGKDKKVSRELAAQVRNSITLVCRGAVESAVYDDRADTLSVRFYHCAVRFPRHAELSKRQRTIIIEDREFNAEVFGLRDFDLTEIEKETD